MRKIDQLLTEYGSSHQNHTNKQIHWICVPLIFFSIVGLLWSIPHEALNHLTPAALETFVTWATVALTLVLIYYLVLSIPLFFGMLIFSFLCLMVCYLLEKYVLVPLWLICSIIFLVAWIGQFYGHRVEGKKPSFLKDIQFLLIGPAWLMHFILKSWGMAY